MNFAVKENILNKLAQQLNSACEAANTHWALAHTHTLSHTGANSHSEKQLVPSRGTQVWWLGR